MTHTNATESLFTLCEGCCVGTGSAEGGLPEDCQFCATHHLPVQARDRFSRPTGVKMDGVGLIS